jgi:hypothetical protein
MQVAVLDGVHSAVPQRHVHLYVEGATVLGHTVMMPCARSSTVKWACGSL